MFVFFSGGGHSQTLPIEKNKNKSIKHKLACSGRSFALLLFPNVQQLTLVTSPAPLPPEESFARLGGLPSPSRAFDGETPKKKFAPALVKKTRDNLTLLP